LNVYFVILIFAMTLNYTLYNTSLLSVTFTPVLNGYFILISVARGPLGQSHYSQHKNYQFTFSLFTIGCSTIRWKP